MVSLDGVPQRAVIQIDAHHVATGTIHGLGNGDRHFTRFAITEADLAFARSDSAVLCSGLFFILNYTRLGIRIRAGTLDLETVSVLGVNVRVLRNLNFGLGIYLAGLAGVLAVGMLGLQPNIGDNLIMPSFIAIIVGGLGSLPGTLAGGILIGVVSGVTTVFLPAASEAVMYVMMAAVLIVRPRGLLGEEGRF